MDPIQIVRTTLGSLPEGIHLEVAEDHLIAFRRVDMLHLDADALHDRLMHWTRSRLAEALPGATAGVSFRHASPADPHEASTLDLQEGWVGLEPTFSLDLARAGPLDVERFASLLAEFIEVMEKTGRPAGYRTPDVGTME